MMADSSIITWLRDTFEEGDGEIENSIVFGMWPNKEHTNIWKSITLRRVFPATTIQKKRINKVRSAVYKGLRFRHSAPNMPQSLIPLVILSLEQISCVALKRGFSVLQLTENKVMIAQTLAICGQTVQKQLEIRVNGKIHVQMADKAITDLQDYYLNDSIELTLSAVKNLLSIFQSIRACAGFLFDCDINDPDVVISEWQENGKTYTSYRSNKCNWVVPCKTSGATCKECRKHNQHLNQVHRENKQQTQEDLMTEICKQYLTEDLRKNTAELVTGENSIGSAKQPDKFGNSLKVLAPSSGNRKQKEKQSSKNHCCLICRQIFKTRTALQIHKKQKNHQEALDCPLCGKSYSKMNSLRHHMETHANYTSSTDLTCPFCRKKFMTLRGLKRHMRVRAGLCHRLFLCPVCQEEFSQPQEHTRHMKQHALRHLGIKPFHCQVCNREFEWLNSLNKHLLTHKSYEELKYQCETCDEKFRTKFYLEVHSKTHVETLKPAKRDKKNRYKCDECDKEFRIPYVLKIHKRCHTGEKPCLCHICGKAFRSLSNLIGHRHVHRHDTHYKCSHCNKLFHRAETCRRHERIHTSDIRYNCHLCDQSFNRRDNLEAHIQRHLKSKSFQKPEKTFKCDCCEQTFSLKQSRDLHQSVAHPENQENQETEKEIPCTASETGGNQQCDIEMSVLL